MEDYLTLAEVRELLEKEKEDRGELSPEQGYALQHAEAFARIPAKKAKKLVQGLLELEFMSPAIAVKVVDLMPTEPEEVRAIFSKERFTLAKEDLDRVLNLVEKYL
ncbi:MAG: RNA polymerase Rpb4 family protein [Candidatus Thermoplasmatota archaeon]|nr:RNA polymerase Rpb4 family protein [Candidatus Thermoplasmatota archaeon]